MVAVISIHDKEPFVAAMALQIQSVFRFAMARHAERDGYVAITLRVMSLPIAV